MSCILLSEEWVWPHLQLLEAKLKTQPFLFSFVILKKNLNVDKWLLILTFIHVCLCVFTRSPYLPLFSFCPVTLSDMTTFKFLHFQCTLIQPNGIICFVGISHWQNLIKQFGSHVLYRTVPVGSEIYFGSSNAIRTLQVLWHPSSDNHLGILSSDSVFRWFLIILSLILLFSFWEFQVSQKI